MDNDCHAAVCLHARTWRFIASIDMKISKFNLRFLVQFDVVE